MARRIIDHDENGSIIELGDDKGRDSMGGFGPSLRFFQYNFELLGLNALACMNNVDAVNHYMAIQERPAHPTRDELSAALSQLYSRAEHWASMPERFLDYNDESKERAITQMHEDLAACREVLDRAAAVINGQIAIAPAPVDPELLNTSRYFNTIDRQVRNMQQAVGEMVQDGHIYFGASEDEEKRRSMVGQHAEDMVQKAIAGVHGMVTNSYRMQDLRTLFSPEHQDILKDLREITVAYAKGQAQEAEVLHVLGRHQQAIHEIAEWHNVFDLNDNSNMTKADHSSLLVLANSVDEALAESRTRQAGGRRVP